MIFCHIKAFSTAMKITTFVVFQVVKLWKKGEVRFWNVTHKKPNAKDLKKKFLNKKESILCEIVDGESFSGVTCKSTLGIDHRLWKIKLKRMFI